MSAKGAGQSIAGGGTNLAQGSYVAGTAGIVNGGVSGYLAATDVAPDIPTSLPQAVVEGLELGSKLGALIAGNVTEWMSNYTVMEARVTYFTQRVTATPYTVWECRKGVGWVCVERIWEIQVGKLGKRPGPHSRSHLMTGQLERARAERDFARLGRVAGTEVTNSARRLDEFLRSHQGGPCK